MATNMDVLVLEDFVLLKTEAAAEGRLRARRVLGAVRARLRKTSMAMVEINWNPSRKELRQFAAILLAVGIFFGGMEVYRTGALDLGTGSGAGCPDRRVRRRARRRCSHAAPSAVRRMDGARVPDRLDGFASAVGCHVLSRPDAGRLGRARHGNDPMKREFDREAKTYWVEHRTGDDPATYFRQF
jgi:hypothetical protein